MNICIVAHNAYGALTGESSGHIGGVERQAALMSSWFAQKGHNVSIITWNEGGNSEECINGVMVIKLCKNKEGVPLLRFFHPKWTSLNKALASANADIYYHNCYEHTTGQIALWCQWHSKKFIYATASDTDCRPDRINQYPFIERSLFKYGLRHANLLITQTEKQKKLLQENFSLPATVIPMAGTPAVDYDQQDACNELFTHKKITWVGRICNIKRLQWFIDAAIKLPNLEFDVVGPADLSRSEINALINEVKMTANMRYMGKISREKMPEIYKNSAVLCCTSLVEGFPNTFLEAWSYQTPVVTTFDPDGIVNDKQLGLSVSTQAELVSALKTIMEDRNLLINCSRNALKYYENTHLLEKSMGKFERMFADQIQQ